MTRLELLALLLAAKITQFFINGLTHVIHVFQNIYSFTASQIVLSWIKNPSYTWRTFVAEFRKSMICLTLICLFHFVGGEENPARPSSTDSKSATAVLRLTITKARTKLGAKLEQNLSNVLFRSYN